MNRLASISLVSLVVAACTPVGPLPEADWTIMVYVAADNNLERSALSDIAQMAETGSSEDLHLVVQIDRSEGANGKIGYTSKELLNLPQFKTAKRLRVMGGAVEEWEDLGETNTGDPAALTSFVQWATNNFPARKTALVLWDHGGGLHGFGWDDTEGPDGLTGSEIRSALEAGLQGASIEKFDLVGFDACLMANLEVAYELRGLTGLLVASEEIEPSHGWQWREVSAAAKSGTSPEELGRAIVESYATECSDGNAANLCTMSLIDASKVEAVAEAVDDLADALTPQATIPESWLQIASAQSATEAYAKAPDGASSAGVVDAWHLADNLSSPEGDAVKAAIDDAVIAEHRGVARPNAHGISIYFPGRGKGLEPDYESLAYGAERRWSSFLSAYSETDEADQTPPVLGPAVLTAVGNGFTMSTTVEANDLAWLEGYVSWEDDNGGIAIVDLIELPLDASEFTWDRTLPVLRDGAGAESEMTLFYEGTFTLLGEEIREYSVEAEYIPASGNYDDATDVVVYLEMDSAGRAHVTALVEYSEQGAAHQLDPEPGSTLEPYFLGYDANDDEYWQLSDDWLSLDDVSAITIARIPAPSDYYVLGIIAEDHAGNEAESEVDLTL